MRAIPIVLTALLLAGCAAQPSTQAEAAMDQQAAACRAQFPNSRKNFLDRAHCEEAARRTLLRAVGTPSELVEPYLTAIADLAVRIDRGEITPRQARLALAEERALLAEREREQRLGDATANNASAR